MKICLIGGSRGTGAQLAQLATAAGHEVTVLSRNDNPASPFPLVVGDATDPAVAAAAMAGSDAVVVTVGGARGVRNQRAKVTRSVVEAMQQTGVRRLVVQSSVGAGDSGSLLRGPLGLLTKVLLATALADHNDQECIVTESGLDWTVVRPTGLTDKPATGVRRIVEPGGTGNVSGTVTRGDVAAYLLSILEDPATVGKAYAISN